MHLGKEDIIEALCSIQRALLGKVTPNLRAVCLVLSDEKKHLFFYYNTPPSEEEEELASLADTEFISDFPSPDYQTDCTISVIPYPKKMPENGYYVYLRYEQPF